MHTADTNTTILCFSLSTTLAQQSSVSFFTPLQTQRSIVRERSARPPAATVMMRPVGAAMHWLTGLFVSCEWDHDDVHNFKTSAASRVVALIANLKISSYLKFKSLTFRYLYFSVSHALGFLLIYQLLKMKEKKKGVWSDILIHTSSRALFVCSDTRKKF